MGPRPPPRGRHRGLRPAHARRVPVLGPPRGRLRSRAGRRPRGRRPAVLGVEGRIGRRCGHPSLRAALAPHAGPQGPPGPPHPPAPQHHPSEVLPGRRPRHGADLRPGGAGAGDPGLARGPRPRGQRVEPPRARGPGLPAHRRAAHLSRLSPLPRGPEPRAPAAAGGRHHQPPVRGPPGPEQAPGRPDPAPELLAPLHRPRRPAAPGGQAPPARPLLRRSPGLRLRGGLHSLGRGLPGPRGPR